MAEVRIVSHVGGMPDEGGPGFVAARATFRFSGPTFAGEVVADPERLLTGREVSRLLGIQPDTWRSYVNRGKAPPPDFADLDTPVNNRLPRWRLDTVREYFQGKKRKAWKLPRARR